MKAKRVYEFKRTRKQGLSDKTELGLDVLEKREIEKWINKHLQNEENEVSFEIELNNNPKFKNKYTVHFFNPTNFSKLYLYFYLTDNIIPFNIESDVSIELYRTLDNDLKELEIYINSNGYLYINFENKLEKLIGNIKAEELLINDESLNYLPDNIYVETFDTGSMPGLKEIPNNLTAEKIVMISEDGFAFKAGKNLISPRIYVNSYIFKEFSEGTECNKLELKRSNLKKLPEDIQINNYLEIHKSTNTQLSISQRILDSDIEINYYN